MDERLELARRLRDVTDRLARARRALGQVEAQAAAWDLKGLRQRLPDAIARLEEAVRVAADVQEGVDRWGERDLVQHAEVYAERFLAEARAQNLNVVGTFPEFEVFPVRVAFDLGEGQVVIGKRRYTGLEPKWVAKAIRREVERLHRASFNANRFMRALVAYHDLLTAAGRTKGRQARLIDIYRLMALPTGTAGYTRQEFSFAIYRLRRDSDLMFEGRRLTFGHGRQATFAVPNGRGGVDNLAYLEVSPAAGVE